MSRQWKISAMPLALLCLYLCAASVEALDPKPFSRPDFTNRQCGGTYDSAILARLDRMCEDCMTLFREPSVQTKCSKKCFSTDWFANCLVVLNYYDEQEDFVKKVEYLNGKGFERATTTAEPTITIDTLPFFETIDDTD